MNDPARSFKAQNALASLLDEQGDIAQAITLQRRALATCEDLPDPASRATSHHNLANYLERIGTQASLDEFPRHELAALIYRQVAGLWQDLQASTNNYAIRFRHAHAAGTERAIPSVAALIADPSFAPLKEWLRQRRVDAVWLQEAVNQQLAQVLHGA